MRKSIYFITSYAGKLLHPETFHTSCYGSEFALVEIASRLGKEYDVTVFSETPQGYTKEFMNITWRSSKDYSNVIQKVPDYIVISRYINVFLDYHIPDKSKVYVWLHDLVPHMHHHTGRIPIGYMGCVIPRVTKWVPVGNQMTYEKTLGGGVYLSKYGIEKHMCYTIKNGITIEDGWDPLTYKGKVKNSFIYSSWAEKGLWNLLNNWDKVLSIMPDATLNVYYSHSEEEQQKFKTYNYNSVTYHGRVEQKDLFEAMKKSDYWLFPNEFPETCCTTAMEMGYYGVIQITNSKGALKENVGGCLIKKEECDDAFWRTVFDILETCKDDEHLKEVIRKKQFKWCKEQTWDNRAKQWKSLFNDT